jgi:hypothetical protein
MPGEMSYNRPRPHLAGKARPGLKETKEGKVKYAQMDSMAKMRAAAKMKGGGNAQYQ